MASASVSLEATVLLTDSEFDDDDTWLSCDEKPFKQGAEARLYRCRFLGRDAIVKERFAKTYRYLENGIIAETLTSGSKSTEVWSPKILERVKKSGTYKKIRLHGKNSFDEVGIDVPAVYFVDNGRNLFIMEAINKYFTVRQYVDNIREEPEAKDKIAELGRRIGRTIAKLHSVGIVHGDLTTSNMLLRDQNPESLVLIDFGLAEGSATAESKGVDLHVLERTINSTHVDLEYFFEAIMEGYKQFSPKQFVPVEKKLKEIERRGRKREMVG